MTKEFAVTHPEPAELGRGYWDISGTGCDRGWQVLVIEWISDNGCYLNPLVISPNLDGDWSTHGYRMRWRVFNRQSGKPVLGALSVKKGDVRQVQEFFEENEIKESSELEELLRKYNIQYKLSVVRGSMLKEEHAN